MERNIEDLFRKSVRFENPITNPLEEERYRAHAFWAHFRNGFTDHISGIRFSVGSATIWGEKLRITESISAVQIDILSKHGQPLTGGAFVPLSAVIEMSKALLEWDGWTVTKEE